MEIDDDQLRIAVLRRLLACVYRTGVRAEERLRRLELENAQLRAQLGSAPPRHPPTYDQVSIIFNHV